MNNDWKRRVLNERIDWTERMIKKYESSIKYWSDPIRVIASSIRLDQTREFINNMILECKIKLAEAQSFLTDVNAELSLVN